MHLHGIQQGERLIVKKILLMQSVLKLTICFYSNSYLNLNKLTRIKKMLYENPPGNSFHFPDSVNTAGFDAYAFC